MTPREGPGPWGHKRALSEVMGLAPPPSMPGLLQGGEAAGGVSCNSTAAGCVWVARQTEVTSGKHSREIMQSRNQGSFLPDRFDSHPVRMQLANVSATPSPKPSHLPHIHCSQWLSGPSSLAPTASQKDSVSAVLLLATGGGKYLSPEGCCMQRLPAIPILDVHTHSVVQEELGCPQVSIGSSYV